jgi:hypothetical protein
VVMAAIVKAIHQHGDLMRLAIACPGNDFRLGACEAPPAIVSTHLGEDMTNFLEDYISKLPFPLVLFEFIARAPLRICSHKPSWVVLILSTVRPPLRAFSSSYFFHRGRQHPVPGEHEDPVPRRIRAAPAGGARRGPESHVSLPLWRPPLRIPRRGLFSGRVIVLTAAVSAALLL